MLFFFTDTKLLQNHQETHGFIHSEEETAEETFPTLPDPRGLRGRRPVDLQEL